MAGGSLAERVDAHQQGTARISPDPRADLSPPARARHPDPVALDASIQVAAVLVLLEEGVERVEDGHAAVAQARA
jgi:hypothetical protein